jgi:hypothetical protein
MLRKVTVVALLFALVLAAFPTSGVLAGSPVADKLEKKWDQLVDRYEAQVVNHAQMHKLADNWLATNKKASKSDKNEVAKHLDICNTSLAAAEALIKSHPGFDRNGNAVDYALARTTLQKLANYLQQHAGSVKNLKKHIG